MQQFQPQLTIDQNREIERRLQALQIYPGGEGGLQPSPHVQRRFDLYTIEIKSKIIAMFFKFF